MDVLANVADYPSYVLSDAFGAELSGARLFITLLYGYPIALCHTTFLHGKPAAVQHIYFTMFTFLLLAFNFGWNCLHSVSNILLVYPILVFLGGSKFSVVLSLVINLAYLAYGYVTTATDSYIIVWTTPHCVLTLKLIGLTWDLYDGAQPKENIKGNEETAIRKTPSLLGVFGFVFYTPAFMVGPQFSFARYTKFISGDYQPYLNTRWSYMFQRLVSGLLYTLLYPILSSYITTEYMATVEFQELMIPVQLAYISLWGHVLLMRYMGVWLLVEGSCVLSGISYDGIAEGNSHQWHACSNIQLFRFNTATKLQHLIDGFNINTNRWMFRYVYKRLKFLNNRQISQFITLLFLALWHGFHTGYLMTFFLEFLSMNFEKGWLAFANSRQSVKRWIDISGLQTILWPLLKLYAHSTIGYSLISFELFFYDKYFEIYRNANFSLHIAYLSWPLLLILLNALVPKDKSREDYSKKVSENSGDVEKVD